MSINNTERKLQISIRHLKRTEIGRNGNNSEENRSEPENSSESCPDYKIIRLPHNIQRSKPNATEHRRIYFTKTWKIVLIMSICVLLLAGYIDKWDQIIKGQLTLSTIFGEHEKEDMLYLQKKSEKYIKGLEKRISTLNRQIKDDEEEMRQSMMMLMQLKEAMNKLKQQREELMAPVKNMPQYIAYLKEELAETKEELLKLNSEKEKIKQQ